MMNPLTQKAVYKAIAFLNNELRQVLELKYGIGGKPCYTNKKTGQLIGKSARHVDVAENKAIRQLRRPDIAKPLINALKNEDELIWKTISEPVAACGRLVLKRESYETLFEKLPGEILMLIRMAYQHFYAWLEYNTVDAPAACFRSTYTGDEVLGQLNGFSEIIEQNSPPIRIEHFMQQLNVDPDFLRFLLALHGRNFKFYDEYIAEQPISSQVLRAIRIHLMMSSEFQTETRPLDRIIEAFNSIYSDDRLITATASALLNSRPHLFNDSGDGNWSVNKNLAQSILMLKAPDNDISHEFAEEKPDCYFERPWSEMTAGDIIMEIVQAQKICRRPDLVAHFLERTQGRYLEVSILPVIKSKKELINVAPSVCGWAASFRDIDPVLAHSDELLNTMDCRQYILARYAGEPMNIFPLWTPAMERKWCLWAQNDKDPQLYQSLLYIADPDLWPAPDTEKEIWKEKKRWDGCYYFKSPLTFPDWRKLPALQDLFAVATRVKAHGCINGMRINHLLNQMMHTQGAAPILLGLIALNVILPAGDWQQMHASGPALHDFLDLLEGEIKGKGFLHWDDDAGNYLRDYIRDYIREQRSDKEWGWVSKQDRKILTDLVKPGLIRHNIADCKALEKNERHPGEISKNKPSEQLTLF